MNTKKITSDLALINTEDGIAIIRLPFERELTVENETSKLIDIFSFANTDSLESLMENLDWLASDCEQFDSLADYELNISDKEIPKPIKKLDELFCANTRTKREKLRFALDAWLITEKEILQQLKEKFFCGISGYYVANMMEEITYLKMATTNLCEARDEKPITPFDYTDSNIFYACARSSEINRNIPPEAMHAAIMFENHCSNKNNSYLFLNRINSKYEKYSYHFSAIDKAWYLMQEELISSHVQICSMCKKLFYRQRNTAKYCSDSCKQKKFDS